MTHDLVFHKLRQGLFDPYEFIAACRRLGAEFWCIRDKRTGKEEVRATLKLKPAPGMTGDELTEHLHALMLWVQSDPNALAKVGTVVRAEGVIHYPVEVSQEGRTA